MSNTFTSKKQFHKISKLVSSTFDIKESKVAHKLSNKEGYKNANALLASIKPKKENITQKPTFKTMDHIPFNKISGLTNFVKITTNDYNSSRICQFHITAPLFVKMMFDGFVFKDSKILNKKIEGPFERADAPSDTEVFSHINFSFDLDFEENSSNVYSIGALQHIINGYVYSVDELKNFKQDTIDEIVMNSSIEQYNVIAGSEEICSKYDLDYSLGLRYIKILTYINNDYNDYYYYESIDRLDYINTSLNLSHDVISLEQAKEILISLETPTKNLRIYHEALSEYGYEESLMSHLTEYFLGINRPEHSELENTPILFKETAKKDKNLWDDVDFAFNKHIKFIFNVGFDILKYEDDEEKDEYLTNDLIALLESTTFIDYDKKTISDFLSFSNFHQPEHIYDEIDEEKAQYNRFHKEDDYMHHWFNMNIFQWWCLSLADFPHYTFNGKNEKHSINNTIKNLEFLLNNSNKTLLSTIIGEEFISSRNEDFESYNGRARELFDIYKDTVYESRTLEEFIKSTLKFYHNIDK